MRRVLPLVPGILLLFAGLATGAPNREWARYSFSGASAYKVLRPVEGPGYRIALSSPDGKSLAALVEVDSDPLPDTAALPLDPGALPQEARSLLEIKRPGDDEIERRSRLLLNGAKTVLEAVELVIGFTSKRVHYDAPGESAESAERCLSSGRGSCVGRSLLAAELLLRAGIPARQVTGVLAARSEAEIALEARPFFSQRLGGVRHRWIEVYVPGLGWVPSDPAGLANTVTARHIPLKEAPARDFAVETVSRSPEIMFARIELRWNGYAMGRLRSSSLRVTNRAAQTGGAVVLTPLGQGHLSEPSRIERTKGPSVLFQAVPRGDYHVIWKTPDGKVEAASLRVDGPASVELPLDRDGGR